MHLAVPLAAGLLLAAGASAFVLPPRMEAAPPGHDHRAHDHGAHEHTHGAMGHDAEPAAAEDFAWSSPEGNVPDASDASLKRLRSFDARTDRGLAELAAKGFLTGKGTRSDPFLIEGLRVAENLALTDLASHVIVRNNAILGELKVNYDRHHVHVHHNRITDLRVNENIQREGGTTGGLFERNVISVIGQLRHFEGEFRENTVGPRPQGPLAPALGDAGEQLVPEGQAWNFDGFQGALVHHNVVEGLVSIKLHGHEHGSSFESAGHDHAASVGDVDHQHRYHSLSFVNNTIRVSDGPALEYRDNNHAGDDRTANSETEPELELPHVHHTRVSLSDNRLEGGGLRLNIFGAKDERHRPGSDGTMTIAHNSIRFPAPQGADALLKRADGVGMDLHDASGLRLDVRGNVITFESASPLPATLAGPSEPKGTGMLLRAWAGSHLAIVDNAVHSAAVGVRARVFDAATQWVLQGNTFEATKPVDYDRSVANGPG